MARPALDNDHRGQGAGLVHPCQASLGGIRDASGDAAGGAPTPVLSLRLLLGRKILPVQFSTSSKEIPGRENRQRNSLLYNALVSVWPAMTQRHADLKSSFKQ